MPDLNFLKVKKNQELQENVETADLNEVTTLAAKDCKGWWKESYGDQVGDDWCDLSKDDKDLE